MRNKYTSKKGEATDILEWLVISFITVIFLGIFVYATGLLSNELSTIGVQGSVNMSEAGEITVGQINNAFNNGVGILAFVILFMTALSILISNYFIREHPIFLVVHILVTVLAVVLSAYISNTYEALMYGQPFSSNLIAMRIASHIMLYLPTWVTVIGIFGAIILFVRITRTREDFE